ncbi:hypothetical protein [Peptoniphilus catoniae]|uniref:hypothetical protein n=1 Tax=Peptoniphilus catoniae TaxID=1660341 RepID=UPI0010FE8454|nr:hypothetical protein [Peptoniphilus catoniae]
MKLIEYSNIENYKKVSLLFDDNKYGTIYIADNERPKEEILKDAYILLKNADKKDYMGDISKLEDIELETSKAIKLYVDFYNLTAKVYDQYGDEIQEKVNFTIEGTDKARIENNKIIEEEVTEITSYFIVAKCKELIEKEERFIYPTIKEEPKNSNIEERLEATEKAMADLMLMIGGM